MFCSGDWSNSIDYKIYLIYKLDFVLKTRKLKEVMDIHWYKGNSINIINNTKTTTTKCILTHAFLNTVLMQIVLAMSTLKTASLKLAPDKFANGYHCHQIIENDLLLEFQ